MSRSRRMLSAFVVTAMLLVALGTAAAAPASAQQRTTNATVCFYYAETGGPAANFTLKIFTYSRGAWVLYKSGKTNSSGCGTFRSVPSSGTYYFEATRLVSYSHVDVNTWYTCQVIDYWQGASRSGRATTSATTNWGSNYVYYQDLGTCY